LKTSAADPWDACEARLKDAFLHVRDFILTSATFLAELLLSQTLFKMQIYVDDGTLEELLWQRLSSLH
jgi:hypothetical protein